MPIDIRRNFVFIHIPKTGGTSIERMFHLVGREHLFSYLPLPYFVPANKSPQHLTWLELKKNIEVALQMHSTPSPGFDQTCKEFLENAYKFAFVRNPWDRFLSEYYWRKAWYFKELQKGINFFYSPNVMESLDTFVSVFDLPEEKRMDKKRGGDGHWETQLSFLVNESGKIAVNFVGRGRYCTWPRVSVIKIIVRITRPMPVRQYSRFTKMIYESLAIHSNSKQHAFERSAGLPPVLECISNFKVITHRSPQYDKEKSDAN
jgi:Sulfotransferase family